MGGKSLVLVLTLTLALVAGCSGADRSDAPKTAALSEANVRTLVGELALTTSYTPISTLVTGIAWPDLTACLGLGADGRVQHSTTIDAPDYATAAKNIAAWLEHDRELHFTAVPAVTVVAPESGPDGSAAGEGGRYDPTTGAITVYGAPDARPSPFSLTVLAHELDHALVDQNLHNTRALSSLVSGSEPATAQRAVAEGDATLEMVRFALAAFPGDGDLEREAKEWYDAQIGKRSKGIAIFVEALYAAGFAYACRTERAHGWSAVNDAYQQPTTYKVLFPDRSVSTEPLTGTLPRPHTPPGTGWTRTEQVLSGWLSLTELMENGPSTGVLDAVATLRIAFTDRWTRAKQLAATMALVGSDDTTLCGAVRRWRAAPANAASPSTVECDGRVVYVGWTTSSG